MIWIELYKSDCVADISLTQWLALTPPEIVAATLKIPISVVEDLKKREAGFGQGDAVGGLEVVSEGWARLLEERG